MSRVVFQPYSHEQLGTILQRRLRARTCVQSKAIEMVSRKVAAVTGDLRKAIDMLLRACEIALRDGDEELTTQHVSCNCHL